MYQNVWLLGPQTHELCSAVSLSLSTCRYGGIFSIFISPLTSSSTWTTTVITHVAVSWSLVRRWLRAALGAAWTASFAIQSSIFLEISTVPKTQSIFMTIWSSRRHCCGIQMCWQCVICTCCEREMFVPVWMHYLSLCFFFWTQLCAMKPSRSFKPTGYVKPVWYLLLMIQGFRFGWTTVSSIIEMYESWVWSFPQLAWFYVY